MSSSKVSIIKKTQTLSTESIVTGSSKWNSNQVKGLIFTTLLSLSFIQVNGSEKKTNKHIEVSSNITSIRGSRFILKYQVFESHDNTGTDIDTISHQGDYILFSENGEAYMSYNGKMDSIAYAFPNEQSISFGDTPFIIARLGNGIYKLVQNEEEPNGDYNRVTYLLKKDEPI